MSAPFCSLHLCAACCVHLCALLHLAIVCGLLCAGLRSAFVELASCALLHLACVCGLLCPSVASCIVWGWLWACLHPAAASICVPLVVCMPVLCAPCICVGQAVSSSHFVVAVCAVMCCVGLCSSGVQAAATLLNPACVCLHQVTSRSLKAKVMVVFQSIPIVVSNSMICL